MHDEDRRRISISEPPPSAPVSIVPVAIDTQDDAYFDTRGDATQRTHGAASIKWSIADVTTRVLAVRYVPLQHKVIVASALAVAVLILGGAGARAVTSPSASASSSDTTMSAAATSKKQPHFIAPSPIARDKTVRSLAQTQGTITLSRPMGRWIVVDGKRMTKPSVVVTCGQHMVGVGWDRARRLDVPCGGSLIADAK